MPSHSSLPSQSQTRPGRSNQAGRTLWWGVGLRVSAIVGGFATAWVLGADRVAQALVGGADGRAFWAGHSTQVFVGSAVLLALASAAWMLVRGAWLRAGAPTSGGGVPVSLAIPTADAVLVVDDEGRVAAFNAPAERLFGYTGLEAVGRPIGIFLEGDLAGSAGALVLLRGLKKGGASFPAETSVSPLGGAHGGLHMLVVRDVTVRVAHEIEIERLKRLYAALSQINQAIVWMKDRAELFQKICQVLAEYGGFRMAWIGWHEPDTARIRPVAYWGDEDGYLKTIAIYADDRPEGQGPTGVAFRENRPYVCNDLLNDAATLPFRPHATRHGFRSSAVFPIRMKGAATGTLSVYADEPGFFQEKEIALLSEAAFDISFALDSLAGIAERAQAEAIALSEKLFSDTIIESMPGILYFYNDQGRFLRWNRNFETVSGYSGEEIARMTPLDFFAGADKAPLAERIAEVFAQGEASVQASFLSKNGRSTPYYFTGRRLDFQGMRCLVGVGIDISERQRAETALRELAATLEQRVADRTAELQAALVRAEAADRLKSSFLATMSHELRTPLNSIIGFTGIVLRGLAGPLNPEQGKQLEMVRASARHLLELINDVLDLSKIEAGQLRVRFEPFALPAAIERTVALVKPFADKKGLSLSLLLEPGLGEMVSDRRRVEQILLNLLNNAVKFTQVGSVALVAELDAGYRRSPDASPAEAVRLRVVDTGMGIRPENLGALFRPFQQLDTGLAREHEGTGLGLAICRRLAGLLEGEIFVESQWTKGSVFTVVLPLKPRSEP